MIRSENQNLRSSAAETLGLFGRDAEEALPALLEALDDEESFVCAAAKKALSLVGPPFESVSHTDAIAGLSDKEASARRNAVCALVEPRSEVHRRASADSTVRVLRKALGDSDASVRATAAAALGHLGPRAKAAKPALIVAASRRLLR